MSVFFILTLKNDKSTKIRVNVEHIVSYALWDEEQGTIVNIMNDVWRVHETPEQIDSAVKKVQS